MATFQIPAPAPLVMSGRNLEQNWTKFIQRFQNFEIATGIKAKGDATRIATLLSVVGQDAVDTYNTFTYDAEGDDKKFDKVVEKFATHCKGKKNITYERYVFNCRVQAEGESVDTFVTALKTLADTCEFGELKDSLILDRVIIGIKDKGMKQRLLRTDNLTLDTALTQIRAATAAASQIEQIANAQPQPAPVNALRQSHNNRSSQRNRNRTPRTRKFSKATAAASQTKRTDMSRKKKDCRNCGGPYPHENDHCPAQGKQCNYCKKLNHYEIKCRAKRRAHANAANAIDTQDQSTDNSDSDDDYAYVFSNNNSDPEHDDTEPQVPVKLNGENKTVLADSGARTSVMNKQQYDGLSIKPQMTRPTKKIFAYGSKRELFTYGKITVVVECNGIRIDEVFHIVKASGVTLPLLSYAACKALKIITINAVQSQSVNEMSIDDLVQNYEDRFTGLGKLNDAKCQLHVNGEVKPLAQPHRRIPFPVRKKVETELDRLKELDVIEPVVDTPTPWISPIRVVQKPKSPGEIRLCVDMDCVPPIKQ